MINSYFKGIIALSFYRTRIFNIIEQESPIMDHLNM